MASLTEWTWVWVNSGSWRWTGKPGVLQSMGSQELDTTSNWTELNWTEPIISWQIDGEKVETVTDFIILSSKITVDGDCSHEIKRYLLLGRKVMTNLDSILKSRDITLLTRVCMVKAMAFPVVMYGCKSWTIRRLSTKELMLSNCGVGEDSWGTLGEKGDQTSQS